MNWNTASGEARAKGPWARPAMESAACRPRRNARSIVVVARRTRSIAVAVAAVTRHTARAAGDIRVVRHAKSLAVAGDVQINLHALLAVVVFPDQLGGYVGRRDH